MWRPACAAEYALVAVVSIASTAHIEPTLTIEPPPRSRIAGHDGLRDPERRPQDRAERLLQVLLGLLEERRRPEDAGAVDEHVDAAEPLDRRPTSCLSMLAADDLAGVDVRALAGRVELGLRLLEHRMTRAAEHDARALLEQPPGRLPADAASAAGDDCDFVFE